MEERRYGIAVRLDLPLEQAEARVREALGAEGFGILTEIDVASTLRQKLGVDWPPQKILGACNPQLAHRALEAEADVGLLLPCNVVVAADGDGTVVSAADPLAMLGVPGDPALQPIAAEARQRLERALRSLEEVASRPQEASAQASAATA